MVEKLKYLARKQHQNGVTRATAYVSGGAVGLSTVGLSLKLKRQT